ncbi:MAG: TonB-dependent receptor plug domain-containing protein, partial [Dehalococcoidia bacterium]
GDDIRRSGARSLPEALRLAPGVQVARIDGGTWAIGMRGFADRLARSMLVLIDGRAVYDPLFAGTYWETQDTLLADVDRIEVIRGPGGTLWGSNAVNGIVNIITKPAARTQGLDATLGGGSRNHGFASARYGAAAGADWDYRIYGKVFDRGGGFHADGREYDGLRMGQGGFRADWTPPGARRFTLQGDVYSGRLGRRTTTTSFTPPFSRTEDGDAPLAGGNLLARWNGPFAGLGRFQLQTFYARTSRDERPVAETRDTFDVDFQQTPGRWGRHQLTWGTGFRVTSGRIRAVAPTAFLPDRRTDHLVTAFVQDEIAIRPDRLRLTLGSKVGHNDYSGVEFQPGVRMAWTPNADHTLWGAVTRAVRIPSRVETDYTTTSLVTPAGPVFVRLEPNPDFRPEQVLAYEAGYRIRPAAPLYVSVAAFYDTLDDVLSTEVFPAVLEPADAPARVVVPVSFGNGLAGQSRGVELSADLRATDWWRWTANYSYVRIDVSKQPGSRDGASEQRDEGLTPRHQAQLQSSLDLPRGWTLDLLVRAISELAQPAIPGYVAADVRLGWHVRPRLELAFVAQDLGADPWHVEWPGSGGAGVGIRRSGYVELIWRQ